MKTKINAIILKNENVVKNCVYLETVVSFLKNHPKEDFKIHYYDGDRHYQTANEFFEYWKI